MKQSEQANIFQALHEQPNPLILFNVWDAATANAVIDQGAKAVATGSWSMAAAHGYPDGQNIPLDLVVQIVGRIVSSVDVPVSVDFEGGYADDLDDLADNFKRIINSGAVGVNFEDQIIGQNRLQTPSSQARRIETLANTASKSGIKIFLNARTDIFLLEQDARLHPSLMDEAKLREKLYAEAGATGFFTPGLSDRKLISSLCNDSSLPINIMAGSTKDNAIDLKALGVSRVSFGPHPFHDHIKAFKLAAGTAINVT